MAAGRICVEEIRLDNRLVRGGGDEEENEKWAWIDV